MKHIFALGALMIVGAIGWQIGERLSSDAISMALGVLFGVLAGLPVALLFLASDRRPDRQAERPRPPTVILMDRPPERPQWRIVGEQVRQDMEQYVDSDD